MRIITFDIETSNQFSDVGANDPTMLNISLVGIHDSETDSYDSFLVSDFPRLWKVIEGADALVGYNSDHFDIPLLNKYYPGDLKRIKSVDILKEIYATLGRRIRLDVVAEGTLGTKKGGSGLDAIKWWRNGDVEKVRAYCLKDVEITRKIFDYALEHGSLKYKELGKTKELKLDTKKWLAPKKSALTHTLGF
jgi:DEAD/DEAH box helicase domain-containing protein